MNITAAIREKLNNNRAKKIATRNAGPTKPELKTLMQTIGIKKVPSNHGKAVNVYLKKVEELTASGVGREKRANGLEKLQQRAAEKRAAELAGPTKPAIVALLTQFNLEVPAIHGDALTVYNAETRRRAIAKAAKKALN